MGIFPPFGINRWDNRVCVLGIFCGVLTPGIGGTKMRQHDLTTGSDRSPQVCGAAHHRSNEIWAANVSGLTPYFH